MALKLTFDPTSPLLNAGTLPASTFYVRATGINASTLTNTGIIPLFYKVVDAAGQPSGEWLTGLPLPTCAAVMRPRELMMEEGTTPFRQAYDVARTYLRNLLGEQATITDLL